MHSIDAAMGELTAAVSTLADARLDALDTEQRLSALSTLTTLTRRLVGVETELIAGLSRGATPAELGDGLTSTLSRALLITPSEAKARLRDSEDTAIRTAVTGETRPARFPATAEVATRLRPDELRKAANQLLAYLGHEDDYTETDRSRRRGFTWSHQDSDGMSKGVLIATPALRAEIDAALAAWAAPGKCNPNDESPCLDGDPDAQTAEYDTRTPAQRRHDALSALTRAMLASGQLGQHNGLPVTVIVTATLQELQTGTGKARTGGGTLLPMPDVIRMAAHSNHYLAIFDGATELPLWLGRTRRTASPGQRIVLHAKDRGCSFPGCYMPGYLCQVHHAVCDWVNGGLTNIDELTFCCATHHEYVTNRGWTTHKKPSGTPSGDHRRRSTYPAASTATTTPSGSCNRRSPANQDERARTSRDRRAG